MLKPEQLYWNNCPSIMLFHDLINFFLCLPNICMDTFNFLEWIVEYNPSNSIYYVVAYHLYVITQWQCHVLEQMEYNIQGCSTRWTFSKINYNIDLALKACWQAHEYQRRDRMNCCKPPQWSTFEYVCIYLKIAIKYKRTQNK